MNFESVRIDDRVGLRAPLAGAALILLVAGFAHSLAGALLGRLLFPAAAQGSLLYVDGRVVGSRLLAQPFADARYFQPRPSAANFDPVAAAGSNMARSHPDLRAQIESDLESVSQREGIATTDVPAELVTRSGSGFDPHLSPGAAQVQIARVARARGLSPDHVARLVLEHTQAPQFGLLGAARVNVLELNLALDRIAGSR